VIDRAREWRAGAVVATMLQRAARVLGVPVPQEVITTLVPRQAQRAVADAVDALWPPQRSIGRTSLGRLITSTTRGDTRSTARALLQHAHRWVRRSSDPAILRPSGDEHDRDRFFETVSSTPDDNGN
jgi:hypothetical protein